jgi:hypothetical protein
MPTALGVLLEDYDMSHRRLQANAAAQMGQYRTGGQECQVK